MNIAYAAVPSPSVQSILGLVGGILKSLVPVLIGIALVVFIWNMIGFIANAGDEGKAKEYKQGMIWGIIALFVIVSIWGLVYFIISSLGLAQSYNFNAPPIPQ